MTKIPTQWFPSAGIGYVLPQTGLYFQDNLGNSIVTNLSQNIIPNAVYVIGKYATSWSQVG
jgi:hypothetical protein